MLGALLFIAPKPLFVRIVFRGVGAARLRSGNGPVLDFALAHPDLAGIVVMAAPVQALEALEPLVKDPNRPATVPAPWSAVGVLTEDVGVGGIAYLEMPLGALERGIHTGTVVGDAVNFARRLAVTPANDMTPTILAHEAETAGRDAGLDVEIHD